MNNEKLKLDFNERADSIPKWLQSFQLDLNNLWRYPDRSQLENQMAKDLGLTEGAVLLTNGGDESIELLFKNCKLNDHSMLVPEPCFSQYSHNQSVWKNKTDFVPAQNDLSIDTEAIKANIKAGQWLILTRPNNPTGEYLTNQQLLDLIQTAQQNRAFVFLDEAYIEFANDPTPIDYASFDNLVTLRTFSKAYGLAGARIGYLLGPLKLLESFRKLTMPFNVSRANLQLAAAAWKARDEVKSYCQTIEKNRNQIQNLLQKNGFKPFPSKGNYLLFEANPAQKKMIASVMNKSNILIKTSLNGLPNAIRLTIPEDISRLKNTLKRVIEPEVLAFDMDGVLIDTSQSYDQCIIQTVAVLTQQIVNQTDIDSIRALGGFNNDWVLTAELIKQQNTEVPFETVISTFQKIYLGDDQNIGLVTREQDLLNNPLKQKLFSGDNKKTTAIVTGRPRLEAEQGIQKLNIIPNCLISADDVSEQKPNPEGLLQVLQSMDKQYAWFCGDTVDDMQAGAAAGCVCIGIGASTPEAKTNLIRAGADVVLENINQLETLL